ncbi:hypothetical protein [Streptomyces acidiscabies]|uniref:hypothetical protein n=1 Tax=Streptomyces acidiscabies TaxID=42234 RepID=UPI0007C68799|nr:hypothetical protein [Streptomyces acidiscabies]
MSSEMTPRARRRPSAPAVGTILVDDQGRIGEFRALEDGLWWLRPVKGGTEWTVEPGTAEPADRR